MRNKTGEDSVTAVIEVKITPERGGGFDRLAARIAQFDEVKSCYLMSGGYDLLVHRRGRHLQAIATFIAEKLSHDPGRHLHRHPFPLESLQGKRRAAPSREERTPARRDPVSGRIRNPHDFGIPQSMNLKKHIAHHVRDIPRSGIRDFFEIVQSMKNVISLGIGEPDFNTPWHIREAAIYSLEKGRTGYTSNLGLPRLRESIADYVFDHFGIRYDGRTEVLVTVGVSEAIDLALRALINPGDEVLYHEPCYVSYSPSITLAHGVPVSGAHIRAATTSA